MHIGLQFPNLELAADPSAIRELAQGAEALGFHHLTAFEHVLGTTDGQRAGQQSYDPTVLIHEPMTLLSFIAAVTSRIELVTSVLVLPQRQTALVAKQTAELDLLSGGRLRLGVGVGWNETEFGGMGADFATRGLRATEQIEVLRLLWTQRSVTYHGRFHHLTASGITISPVQRPIPIWMGGSSEPAIRRLGLLGDGWMPMAEELGTVRNVMVRAREIAAEAGRAPDAIGLQGRFALASVPPEEWQTRCDAWAETGATHLVVGTRGAGFTTSAEHLRLAESFLARVS